jgi:DNA (cytosine-5)-methyltransferase 1
VRRPRPTAVDAFCGAGGLTLGLMAAGFDVLLGFDLDPICIKTMHANPKYVDHPVMQADVREMLRGGLLELAGLSPGELDLLAGGPPCQGFSVQRTTGGDEDERSLLVGHYADLVTEVQPKFFLMENVPGIGGKRGRSILDAFKSKMATNGYRVFQETLNAQDYGVPQRRRRVFLLGQRMDSQESAQFRWPSRRVGPPLTVRSAIGHLPQPPTDGTAHPDLANHRADRLSELNKKRLSSLRPGQGRTDLPEALLAECHRRSADLVGHRNVYGRMEWDDVAPTITARFDSFTRGKFGHPEQLRTISLREGALLQTFPTDFQFEGSKVEVARQIGNAVPVELAKALGLAICEALRPFGE